MGVETSENYYDNDQKQKFPVLDNFRMDPFESWGGLMDRGDTVQAQQWLGIPVQRLLGDHIPTLIKQLLLEKAASFDFRLLMEQVLKGKQ